MSNWQPYVDGNLMGTGKFTSAALLGHDGSTWATSKSFSVSKDEAKALHGAFTNPAGILASGLMIGGTKFFAVRCDDRSIYGKKGTLGCVCVKTKQALLVGVYDQGKGTQAGDANMIVEKLADYLLSLQY